MTRLSVLDVIPVGHTLTPAQAIHASMELAPHLEALGYTRLWFAEHHNMPTIASSAPEVLIGRAAGATKTMRIGAGGIMVPNHAPLHVAEVFRTLEALYPGRIDLGLGRAPGTDQLTASALGRNGAEDEANSKLAELYAFARNEFPKNHPFAKIATMPNDVAFPTMWMLGSTSMGAAIAAQLGLGFAFAGHFSMAEAIPATKRYHATFTPNGTLERPELIMACGCICGEDDAHAEYLAGPYRVGIARMMTGKSLEPFPSFAEAATYKFSSDELSVLARFELGAIIGGPETVRRRLEELAAQHDAVELMLSTLIPDPAERRASFTRVAKVWGLSK